MSMQKTAPTIEPAFERLATILKWWTGAAVPRPDLAGGRIEAARIFVTGIQDAFHDAASSQRDTLLALQRRVAAAWLDTSNASDPQTLVALQTEIAEGVAEAAAANAASWSNLTHEVCACCLDAARDAGAALDGTSARGREGRDSPAGARNKRGDGTAIRTATVAREQGAQP